MSDRRLPTLRAALGRARHHPASVRREVARLACRAGLSGTHGPAVLLRSRPTRLPAPGDIALGALKRGDLKRFFAAKAATGLSRRTFKNIWVPLSAMLNAAVDEERIVANPATRLWRRRRARTENEARKCDTLTLSELALVLGTAEKFHADHAGVLYTRAWTGLRGRARRARSRGAISTSLATS